MGNIESTQKETGLALIIHHDKFEITNVYLEERDGNDVDVKCSSEILSMLGFDVEEIANPTVQDIKNKIISVANDEKYSDYQCLVVIVMTHGSYGGKLYAKDNYYYTCDIWQPLIRCANFEKKPKILIFQACRGEYKELAIVKGCVKNHGKTIPFNNDNSYLMPMLPHDSSFFLAFSTVENKNAIRNKATGSWYIQSVYNAIKELQVLYKVDNNIIDESIDLLSLMTQVNYDMVKKWDKGFAQTPSYLSFLSKTLYIRIKNNDTMSAQPSTSANVNLDTECAITSNLTPRSDIQIDGIGSSEEGPLPSHYSWERKFRGRCLIFYDAFHKSKCEDIKSALEIMQFKPEMIKINNNDYDIEGKLKMVASEESLEDCNCLLVVILSKIRKRVENNKEFEETHVAFNTSIEDTWSPFIAAKCTQLHGKPKIFLYLDNLQTTDSEMPPRLQVDSYHSIVTDHADFFYVFGYGEGFITSLCDQLKDGFANQLELHKIVTKSIEQAEEYLRRLANIVNLKKVSYIKSTLSLDLIFGFQKNTKSERFNAYKAKLNNQNSTISNINLQDGNCLPIIKKLKNIKYSKEEALQVDGEGNTLLHKYARKGDIDAVKELINIHKLNINNRNENGNTPIQMAAMNDSLDIVQYLIEKGADVNERQNDSATTLQIACLFGTIKVVQCLIENGAEVDAIRLDGDTALQVSAADGKLDLVKLLIDKGADVKQEKVDKTTALIMASHCGALGTYECMKYLYEKGAEINVQMYTGKSPLYLAVASNRIDKAKFLIENGADIDIKTNDGITILQTAVQYSNIDMLNYLLENKINLYDTKIDGCSALHIAAEYGKFDNFSWLLNQGFDINIKSLDESTPLHKACMCKQGLEIVNYLTEKGANVNNKKKNGDTPLHIACESGLLLIAQKLYEKNANINEINCNKWTPLHKAIKRGACDIIKWLLDIDCVDFNMKNEVGENGLDIAIRLKKTKIIDMLKEKMNASKMDTL